MGSITRQDMPWMDKKYKAKILDEALKDAVKVLDRNFEVRAKSCPLDGVDSGYNIRYDMRSIPWRAGFPKGDRRRW